MRLSTTAWFAAGCGLALLFLAAGLAVGAVGSDPVLDGIRSYVSSPSSEQASLHSMTPASDPASEHTVMPPVPGPWSDISAQRPPELRESPPVAPPLSFRSADDVEWKPGEARLPPVEAAEHWNPDDARIPVGAAVVATRAYWNPNSAVLPRPSQVTAATWNPDDARLPSS
ncbi:MAG: hypothetical protein ACRBN8_16425 [Nannocystales bacterium]